jgi:hypothetical protein
MNGCDLYTERIESLDYSFSLLSVILYVFTIHGYHSRTRETNSRYLQACIILALLCRLLQWRLIIHTIRSDSRCRLKFRVLFTFYICHYILFSGLYYLNYCRNGIGAFRVDVTPEEFDKDLHVNLAQYTTTISLVIGGHGDVIPANNFGKTVNIFHMIDASFLIGFLFVKLFESLKYN